MRSTNLLIKPVSSSCNLRCSYCFYFDEANHRTIANYGKMSDSTLENLVKNVFESVTGNVNFVFQGGEPTLAGISFYDKFHEYVNQYNVNGIRTSFAMQTNGTLLNKVWFELFVKYNYLIGVSLDGIKETHNMFRKDIEKKGTFDCVYRAINGLKNYNIQFNILCVVNRVVADNGKKIYEYFKNEDIQFIQFIPALDSLKDKEFKEYTLTPEKYGIFLDEVFNLWYEDFLKGKIISIRYYENLLLILLGRRPESCDMVGNCSINIVVESDGSVYPCDFYVLDNLCLGNINKERLTDMISSKKAVEFVKNSFNLDEKCTKCTYLNLCKGGCLRHKNKNYENKFCESYLYFYQKNYAKLTKLKEIIQKKYIL